MKIAFTLSMPNCGSWNGRWSGEGRLYVVIESFTSQKAKANAKRILEKGSYYYRWDDGWGASIAVKEVDSTEARRLRKESKGFCGYEWMVESIIRHGKIYASHEEIPTEAKEVAV